MFTKDQIQEAFAKVKSGADFPQLVQDLKAIGVLYYENFVMNGRTDYHGKDGFVLEGGPKYPDMPVNDMGSDDALKHALLIHQQGKTDYPTFCVHAADAGVEKWITHMVEMTVTYLDQQGTVLVVEGIPRENNY